MRFGAVALVLLTPWALPAPATAGAVSGVLWSNHALQVSAASYPGPAPTAALVRGQRGIADAVVWVDAIPERLERRLARGRHRWFWQRPRPVVLPSVVQRAGSFSPRVLAVVAGSSVEFRNRDRVYHNVFSVSAARRFDLGKYAPGRADTVDFAKPGVVNLHCDIHPEELGFVVVVPNHAFAHPDSLGAFALPALPPGRYTLHAWHPRLGELKRPFEAPKRGGVELQLDF
jgi:hypothetical protein